MTMLLAHLYLENLRCEQISVGASLMFDLKLVDTDLELGDHFDPKISICLYPKNLGKMITSYSHMRIVTVWM